MAISYADDVANSSAGVELIEGGGGAAGGRESRCRFKGGRGFSLRAPLTCCYPRGGHARESVDGFAELLSAGFMPLAGRGAGRGSS
jgi:hypothetical protein